MEKELIKDLLRKSYKKLKSSIFFDKTQLILRDKIVKNEAPSDIIDFDSNDLSNLGIEKSIEQIAEWIAEDKWGELYKCITDSINVSSFPKNLQELETDNMLVTNVQDSKIEVRDAQYFIDMSVEGYLLGVAWLLIIGYHFDQDLYEHSYGNRLRPNLLNEKQKPTFSPYLFSPYFQQYESWRDSALEYAKKSLQKNQNVVLFTMDLKRFFYQVNINEKHLLELVDYFCEKGPICNEYKDLIHPLSVFVWKVIEKYSNVLRQEDYQLVEDRMVLPIGFLPSNVLANYCLKKFDDTLINGWNPLYYGRYVDDIIIVDKVEKNSILTKKANDGNLTSNDVIDYYLLHCDAWRRTFDRNNSLLQRSDKYTNRAMQEENINDDAKAPVYYSIHPDFIEFEGSEIIVQNKKVKIFYFDSSQSDVLLSNFQKVLRENKSEFRFLPEDQSVFQKDDYSEIYVLKEQEGPNKLRGVENISIDKFQLSKFLGKYMRVSGLIADHKESCFDKDIELIFTPRVIIENYSTWEKIIEILIINERLDTAKAFILKVVDAIFRLEYSDSASNGENMRRSLLYVLIASIHKVHSLIWGHDVEEYLQTIYDEICSKYIENNELHNRYIHLLSCFDYRNITSMRKKYCETRMTDKYAMPMAVDGFLHKDKCILSDNDNINLATLNADNLAIYDYDCLQTKKYQYYYYPYLVTMNDLTIYYELRNLYKGNLHTNNEDIVKELKTKYFELNYIETSRKKSVNVPIESQPVLKSHLAIRVGTDRKQKIKFAVANTMLYDADFEAVLRDAPNRRYKRYCELVKMINEAIQNKVDVLVMPEGYVPFEWLPILSRTCAKNQMAIVTGIEHLKLKNYNGKNVVYNLTAVILPYVEDDYRFSYIHFHPKTHFAPHEKTAIESYGCNAFEGDGYQLFCWNDLWFPVYCCYELTSIQDRALFQSYADAVVAVEWNKDTNYYSNIVESLSRDLHCYCIQVNTSKYGDSRIIQPTKTEQKDILNVKGGITSTILIDNIDIEALRDFQLKGNLLQMQQGKGIPFKPTPPDFNRDVVQAKIDGTLWKKTNLFRNDR